MKQEPIPSTVKESQPAAGPLPARGDRFMTRSEPMVSYLDLRAGMDSDRAPLLLLHGVGSSSKTWRRLIPYLGTRRVIAPDYRGHGESAAPEPPYVIDDFVDDALRLMDELDLTQAHVLGFSIGALFAERMAITAPERVRSLVLLNSIANRTEEERARATARLAHLSQHPPSETAPASAQRWFTPAFLAANPDVIAEEIEITAAIAHAPYAASYAVLAENDPIDEVAAITCPTLIVTGADDVGSTPAMSEALHRNIASSRLVILPDVKHYIHIECPDRLASEVNAFLEDVDSTDRPAAAPSRTSI